MPTGTSTGPAAPRRSSKDHDELRDQLRELLKAIRLVRHPAYQRIGVPEGLMGLLAQIVRSNDTGFADATGCHVKDLAERLALDPSTVSRGVSTLVAFGLVERRSDPTDRRASILVPTEAGRAALDEADAWFRQVHAEALAGWDAEQLSTFVDGLRRFTEDLNAYLARRRPVPPVHHPYVEPSDPARSLEAAR